MSYLLCLTLYGSFETPGRLANHETVDAHIVVSTTIMLALYHASITLSLSLNRDPHVKDHETSLLLSVVTISVFTVGLATAVIVLRAIVMPAIRLVDSLAEGGKEASSLPLGSVGVGSKKA